MDFRAETRAAQLVFDNLQNLNLNPEQRIEFKDKVHVFHPSLLLKSSELKKIRKFRKSPKM